MDKDWKYKLALVVIAFLSMPFTAALRGFVLVKLWVWFVVPLGAPTILISHAIGLSILVAMLTRQSIPQDKTEEAVSKLMTAVLEAVFQPLLVLLMGWIVHSIMVS